MASAALAVLLLLTVIYMNTSSGLSLSRSERGRRQSSSGTQLPRSVNIQSLQNAPRMNCSDALDIPFARMVQLTDSQLKDMFENHGGNYVREYMAATAEEARNNFPNLLQIPMSSTPSANMQLTAAQNQFSKQTVLHDLAKLVAVLENDTITTPGSTKIVTKATPNVAHSSDYPSTISETSHTGTGSKIESTTISSTAETVTSPTSDTTTQTSSTIDQEVKESIDQLMEFVNGNHSIDYGLVDMFQGAPTTLSPSVLSNMRYGSRRRKRLSDGSSTMEEYCLLKGSPTDDGGYVHLCSSCAATTTLPDGYFPRYINEVTCKTHDTGCFSMAGVVHGQCKGRQLQLKLFRRRPSHCMAVLHDGETLVIEDWFLEHRSIRASCECTLNKLSYFRQYVAPAPPLG